MISTMSKVFLDTNILVYSLEKSDKRKRDASRSLLIKANKEHQGVISTQVMQEFFVTATRKLGADPLIVKGLLASFGHFEVVTITPHLIREAVDTQILSRLSFWDALIVVAAESARCEAVWSEDLNTGQIIRGVRIENPLRDR
jgi:predicted nucleic acid-binding protein